LGVKNTLTERQIQNAKPREKNYKLYDSEGLFLLVHKAGGKYWKLKYRYAGKDCEMSLGVYPSVTLAQARKARAKARIVLSEGRNPNTTKGDKTTFREDALEWFAKREGALAEKTLRKDKERFILHIFPAIGSMASRDVLPSHIIEMGKGLEKKGISYTAKRCITLTGQVYQWLVIQGRVTTNPAYGLSAVVAPAKGKHNPHLTARDLPEFIEKLYAYPQTSSQCAARFLLLTMVRTSEMRFATWDEIDWDRKLWRIPAQRMKMRRDHLVPLSSHALEILEKAKVIADGSPYLFNALHKGNHPISENAVLYVIEALGYKGKITGHGFRSTASTILNEHGFSADAIERQLAHVSGSIRAVYNHAEYLPERARMMQWWGDFLELQHTPESR
jgi:integrase